MTARLSQLQHREATITQRVTELRSLFANAFSGFDFGDAQQTQQNAGVDENVDDADAAAAQSSVDAKQAQRDVQAALAESEAEDAQGEDE